MKKRISIFLVIIMSFFLLVACEKTPDNSNGNNGDNNDNDNQVDVFESALLKLEDNNYEVLIEILGYGELITTNKMSFDGNVSQYEDENYIEIYEKTNDKIKVYTKVSDDWVTREEEIPTSQGLDFYKAFTKEMFNVNGDSYSLVNEDDQVVMGFIENLDFDLEINTVELDRFQLVIKDGIFSEIDMRLNINSYIYTIKLTFGNYGVTKINVPK